MKNFVSIHDVADTGTLLREALALKRDPLAFQALGKNKTLGLIFMNPSLRTRLSTQKAAMNLGMQVLVLNVTQESWALEFEEGAVMNGTTVEHVKDAAAVISLYCDIVAIRCFPSLLNREEDYNEMVLKQFMRYCSVPVISLESATRHPLQSFADLITIAENKPAVQKPKIVLTWAPHIKPLPQAVANSFSEWMLAANMDLCIAQPAGYELEESFTKGARIVYDQTEALKNADFVYVKNWSSYRDYGKILATGRNNWLLDEQKMRVTNQARIMHCLPVRRNVELSDALLDSKDSLVLQQAGNRVYAAQAVLKQLLQDVPSTINMNHAKEKITHR